MTQFSIQDTAELHRDYHNTLAFLRHNAPVYHIEEVDAYYVTPYDDVKHVLMHPEDYSSTAVTKLLYSGALTGGMPAYSGRTKAMVEVNQMIGSDPPEHTRLRGHVNKPFMPARIASREPQVREICTKLLDEAINRSGGSFDIVNEVAVPMTLNVLAMFLGVDPSRYSSFRQWTIDFIKGISGKVSPEQFAESSGEMGDYLWSLVEARRQDPREDMITALAQAQQEDPEYTDKHLMVTIIMLLTAGHETTTNLISNATRLFCDNPEQYQKLKNDPGLMNKAIYEVLRFDSPVSMQVRMTTRDVELHGVTIPEGRLVMAGIGSANLDETVFDDPETFDITRDNTESIPFGHGIHFCVGAAVAKLEGRVALEEIMKRFDTLKQAEGTTFEWHDSLIFRGPQSYTINKP